MNRKVSVFHPKYSRVESIYGMTVRMWITFLALFPLLFVPLRRGQLRGRRGRRKGFQCGRSRRNLLCKLGRFICQLQYFSITKFHKMSAIFLLGQKINTALESNYISYHVIVTCGSKVLQICTF